MESSYTTEISGSVVVFFFHKLFERLPYSPCLIFDLTVTSFSSQRVQPLWAWTHCPIFCLLPGQYPLHWFLCPSAASALASTAPASPACAPFAVDTLPGIQGLLKGPCLRLVPHSINLRQNLFFLPSVTFADPLLFLCLHLPWWIPPPLDFI